ncbi:rhomboid family intramembrane serine protease [Pseudomonas sp. S75]|uniref:rhomboid family intramembrane serine protease n=1 Tax=unclassified Pseudomonas TaxID=196821 RepID=UPI001907EB23|nr:MULTISPECIES: rhomboid family intramembrane serine protease [unclassified Pseudomonas]MBJ9977720.1 rhomboid family intramembrane serine protease [Pseudomonas sp. S30]MBK0155287.1 rhomboid family intramembrane serine protease [Pseudomonas sp. S75]
MNVIEVLRLPLSVDLGGFVTLLGRLHVPHRVVEENAEQVLWVPPAMAEQVLELYRRHPDGDADLQALGVTEVVEPTLTPTASELAPSLKAQALACKATVAILLMCLPVVALTGLGDNLATLRWFTFQDYQVQGDYLYFVPLAQSLGEGQWWRPITPIFLHFGVLHLLMNGLWFWELGRRIERRQGPWTLLVLTLVFGLVSNLAQHVIGGPNLFGGLSGVLYGLLGYLWLYQRLAPNRLFELPRGVLAMMLVWLVVCMTGVVGQLGFGEIANAAHVGGLLIGCLTGLLGGLLARRKLSA